MKTLIISNGRSGSKFLTRLIYSIYQKKSLHPSIVYEPLFWKSTVWANGIFDNRDFHPDNIDFEAVGIHMSSPLYEIEKRNFDEIKALLRRKIGDSEHCIVKINRALTRSSVVMNDFEWDCIIYLYSNPYTVLTRLMQDNFSLDGLPHHPSIFDKYLHPEVLKKNVQLESIISNEKVTSSIKNGIIWSLGNNIFIDKLINDLTLKDKIYVFSLDGFKYHPHFTLHSLFSYFHDHYSYSDAVEINPDKLIVNKDLFSEFEDRIIKDVFMKYFYDNLNKICESGVRYKNISFDINNSIASIINSGIRGNEYGGVSNVSGIIKDDINQGINKIEEMIISGHLRDAEIIINKILYEEQIGKNDIDHALRIVEEAVQNGHYQLAKRLILCLLYSYPNNVDALNNYAVIEILEQQYENAHTTLDQIFELDPTNETALANMSVLQECLHTAEGQNEEFTVSAIVSVYNCERFMKGCMDDLVNQSLFKKGLMEIVIVNSGSQQREDKIIEEYRNRYPNIQYIKTDSRETVYQAWNRGIRSARGRYITNANTDDRHVPNAIEVMACELDENPDVGVVYGGSYVTEIPDTPAEQKYARGILQPPEFDVRYLYDVCYIGPQPTWRKQLHLEFGFFDELYTSAGDYEYWLRLAAAGIKMKKIPLVLGSYLNNSSSISLSNLDLNWKESERARNSHWQVNWGERPPTRWESYEIPLNKRKENPNSDICVYSEKQKLLLVCDYFYPSVGGVEIYIEELALRLKDNGYDIEVACRYLMERKEERYKGFTINQCRVANEMGTVPELLEIIKSEKFDAVVVVSQPDNWIGITLANLPDPHPRLIFLPSINSQNIENWTKKSIQKVTSMLRSVDHLVAVTENGHDYKVCLSTGNPVVFIPHAVDRIARDMDFRQEYGFDKNLPLIVMVANFWPVKNHDAFLNILSTVSDAWQIALIGNPIGQFDDYYRKIKEIAQKDDRVIIIPGLQRYITNAAIRDADIIVVPSLGESAGPLVILEAMSHGTPWIASPDCNAVSDEAGGIVSPVIEFPDIIRYLIANPKIMKELGELGKEHWKRCFTWDATLPAFLQLIARGNTDICLRYPESIRSRMEMLQDKVRKGVEVNRVYPLTFSIVIPTYNRSSILKRCLDSIQRQTFPLDDIEVLICDDGSTDNTADMVKSASYPFTLRYLSQSNQGPAAARNMGIREAMGKYLLFLNDDALLEKTAVAYHFEILSKSKGETIAVLGTFNIPTEYTSTPLGYVLENSSLLFQYSEMIPGDLHPYQYFYTCNLSILREAVLKAGLFDEDFSKPAAEDIDLGYRLHKLGYRVYYESRAVALHYHELSIEAFCKTNQVRGHGRITLYSKYPELNIFKGIDKKEYNRLIKVLQEEKSKIESLMQNVKNVSTFILPKAAKKEIQDAAGALQGVLLQIRNHFFLTGSLMNPLFEKLLPNWDNTPYGSVTSIIILNLNGASHIRKCVESVRLYTKSRYELIIIDNGSTDDSIEYLRSIPDVTLIENKLNVGAPYGRNQGLAVAKGEYIIFLDNDTIVTEEWLEKFVNHAKNNPEIGMVGPMSNYVSGPQLVTNTFYKNGQELQLFAKRWAERNRNRLIPTGRLILFCLFVKREVIDKIGGIDPAYKKWGWEDDDLSARAQIAGYKLAIAEDIFIHHTGSQTSKTANINYDELLRQNWKVFATKFGLRQHGNREMKYDSSIFRVPFDKQKHFVPLPENEAVEQLISLPEVLRKVQPEQEEIPDRISDMINRASSQEKNGEYAAAADTIAELLTSSDEQALKLLDISIPDLRLLAANYYLRSEHITKAKEYFESALRANPESAEACFGIARCFELSGIQEGAKEMYGWAYKLKPEWDEAKKKFCECTQSEPEMEYTVER